MKKLIKSILIALMLGVVVYSCTENEEKETISQTIPDSSASFFKENISIFDARVRSINSKLFVKELYLVNFSDKKWDQAKIGFEEILFQDDGKGYDEIKGDGVFTSVSSYEFNEKVIFRKGVSVYSVMDKIITSPEFKHSEELNFFKSKYVMKSFNKSDNSFTDKGPKAEISCDVEICSSGCIADWIWEGFGCICVSNCRVTISWDL